jgi:hypothetical protein
MVVYAYNPSYSGGGNRRIVAQGQLEKKTPVRPYPKKQNDLVVTPIIPAT